MIFSEKQKRALRFITEELDISIPETIVDFHIELKYEDTQTRQIRINRENETITLVYTHESLLYRGIFVCLPRFFEGNEDSYYEESSIVEVSYSLDASRNAVMKLDSLKKLIAYLGIMGFNTLYLYTEDTYEVPDLPYFGYLRGAYTKSEIQTIVAFASDFGIEIIPSIQTLAHLTQFLKWYPNHELMDDSNTLLVGETKVYEAIEKMISSCKDLFKSNRIHLGMDEAYQAGLGRYLSLNGYQNRTTLMIQHMKRVLEITKKYELKPMIWSDFIYKLLDKNDTDCYYNPSFELNENASTDLPEGITYVHWDYGSNRSEQYEKGIENHLTFCDLDHYILASGAHIWGSLAPNHGKTETIISATIKACQSKGVKAVMLTTWGDDGQETEHWHSLIGAVHLAECVYSSELNFNPESVFDYLLGLGSYQLMSNLRYFDEVDTVTKNNLNMTNISKLLLWQDPLVGIYDFHVAEHNRNTDQSLGDYYQDLAKKINDCRVKDNSVIALIQVRYRLLAEVLAKKAELGVNLCNARLTNDDESLVKLMKRCQCLADKVDELEYTHEMIWYTTYKTIGWEVLEHRYASLAHRLRTVVSRIENYLAGNDRLDELTIERLPFSDYQIPIEISGFNYRQSSVSGYN